MSGAPRIAIAGAGIGGLTLAGLLAARGFAATVYEQASAFERVGTGIQMGPNAVRILRALGIETNVRTRAATPRHWRNRDGETGELLNELPLGQDAEQHFGAPYLLLHRGDLHDALCSTVPAKQIQTGRQLIEAQNDEDQVRLLFADGSVETADVLVAADGLRSCIRAQLFAQQPPVYTGRVAFRSVFSTDEIRDLNLDDNTKWWGKDRHIVIYYLNNRRDEIYFTTSVPDPDWTDESWSAMGKPDEVREALQDFHPNVRSVLDACPQVHKWAIADRPPLTDWSVGRIVLLGDACHPMTPYMAQGAAQAMEDAMILARSFEALGFDDLEAVAGTYQRTREARASEIQTLSHQNLWMRSPTDAEWLYGYDAASAPLL